MNTYFIEETDTFNGEANYSYCRRYIVKANTAKGAMRKIWNGWRYQYGSESDLMCFNSNSGLTCFFLERIDCEEEARIRERYTNIIEEI